MPADQPPCPRCGTAFSGDARFCSSCGYAAARLTPGQTLDGKYEILEKIGEGGMGEVYKARHVHLDEIRIIKVTKPDAAREGLEEPRRFQEEARLATLVRHPNVAALYDFSRLPDGSFYMVWEFIDGITLEEWLRRHGPLPVDRALDVARQVLAGLSEIHAQGIIHRDLSPDNILLREGRDGKLYAKIIDLGIAKKVAAESLAMTASGVFIGKLKYCSPEQAGALPAGQTVDGRSDLYSFGVVLYEMLTGRPPFESETPEEYLGKHLHTKAPPLDTGTLPPGVGPALAAAVARALEKRREKRFRDAREFSAALESIVSDAAAPESLSTTRWTRARGRAAAWIAGAVLLTAAVAGILTIVRRGGSPGAPFRPTPAVSRLAATPTAPGPDAIVVAPRIIERRTPEQSPAAAPTVTAAPPTQPQAAPPPVAATAPPSPPAADDEVEPAIEGLMTPTKLKNYLQVWGTRPLERRARRALQIANTANFWVDTHPQDSFTAEVKSWLPRALKADTESALEQGKPALARLFYRAYRQLKFAPIDPDLARRANSLRGLPGRPTER